MRIAAVIVVLVALVAGALTTSMTLAGRDRALATEELRTANQAASATNEALRSRLSTLGDRASVLASLAALRAGLTTDQRTVADQLASEGLSGLRDYPLYVIRRPPSGSPDHQPIALAHGLGGLDPASLDQLPAAKTALSGSGASTVVALPGGAALAAFAPVSSVDGLYRGYLVIGEPLDTKALNSLATEARATLVLAAKGHALAEGGDPDVAHALEGALGREAPTGAPPFVDADATVAGHSLALAPGSSLWMGADITSASAVLQHEATLKVALLWLLLGLGGLGLGGLLWWKSRQKPVAVTPLDAWAGVTGTSPTTGTSAPVLVPVMLANGQIGQVVAHPASGVTGTQPAPPPPADPTMFGRYKLLERLGAGGMAEVWIAVAFGAGGFRRPFVVKRILAQHAGNQDLVQQFIDEANLASQLVHSNVVPVFDFGNLNGEYFIAQEYILGKDLGKIVQALARDGRTLEVPLALYVTAELLKALDYAHTLTDKQGRPLGIVHRDLSPNNVLVSGRGEVKLIDFGIAKSETKLSQTEVGTVKGNVRFMAPEQARGETTDPRTDLFSLAASIYFALRGEALYTVTGQYEQLVAAATGPTEVELRKISELPPPIAELFGRALAPKRDDRYPTAQAFLEALLPHVPADGARRLGALVQELFGEALSAEEQKFAAAADATNVAEEATIQRLAPRVRQGIS